MAVRTWTGLELCSGVGMLGIGVKLAIEHVTRERAETVCHVERDAYAAAALVARMGKASLAPAPIWDDLTTFDGGAWRGCVDWIAAGFPCQPWSAAGKQQGTADDRWLWPAIARIIRDAQPTLVFLENVPGLVSGGGLHFVLDDLAEMGFAAEWGHLRASAVGASHRRERVFLVAYARRPPGNAEFVDEPWQRSRRNAEKTNALRPGPGSESMAHAKHGRPTKQKQGSEPRGGRGQLGDAKRTRRAPSGSGPAFDARRELEPGRGDVGDAIGPRPQGRASVGRDVREEFSTAERAGLPLFAPGPRADWRGVPEYLYPATEPGVRVLADGVAMALDESRADQLRCGGNGVVPLQAAACFVELMRRLTR